jgi:hypothetical protein
LRPSLTKDISVQVFKEYYWLKEELQLFCKEQAMSASGSKIEISDRIATFLQTGEIQNPIRLTKGKKRETSENQLSTSTVIAENHRCSQQVRAFFKTLIPHFHFSTFIQNYFKQNVGKTYADVIEAWYEEEKRKKDPSYTKKIAPQFEYNQFIRDYFLDSKNKGKSRKEAIEAWNQLKKLPGSNKYESRR